MDLTEPLRLHDAAGGLVAELALVDRGEWRQADVEWLDEAADRVVVADLLRDACHGMRVATLDSDLASALVAGGGSVTRAGTQMEYDVAAAPPPPQWLRPSLPETVSLTRYAPDPATAVARALAYGPGHPDHDPGRGSPDTALAELEELVGGNVIGPVLEAASVLARSGDDVAGGILVTVAPRSRLWEGPWVADVFVRPDGQGAGLGATLVRYAVAAVAAAGHRGIALVVTAGNPARRVYERVGFIPTHSFTTVALPQRAG